MSALLDGLKEGLAMTSSQRPKECEPSRYRHGCDPPKQVETGSLTDRKCPSTTYSLFHTIPFIQHKVVCRDRNDVRPLQEEVSSMSPATITVVVPSAEKESVFILQAVRAAIHAYRRSRPTSPEVPIDRVKVDEDGAKVSHAA